MNTFLNRLSVQDQEILLEHDKLGIQKLFTLSDYVYQRCMTSPELLLDQLKMNELSKPITKTRIRQTLQLALLTIKDKTALMEVLRKIRHRYLIRIIWQDIHHLVSFESTLKALSLLADVCIEQALSWLYESYTHQYGTPCNDAGVPQQLMILALGKLGGYELNFSSDVDLLFFFKDAGITQGKKQGIDNQVFFNKLGQALVSVLSDNTEYGFVYRVDMRLRPYGKNSALSCSFNAMETYYQSQGRPWERYAFVKARPIAGDMKASFQLLKTLQPFIYRQYLDFSMIDSIREMHQLLKQEVMQKNLQDHIKKGQGGIRDIEFIVQSFQLIYGGKKALLQDVSLLNVLSKLVCLKFMPAYQAQELRDAYLLLRRFEHFIQVWDDQQTHRIPTNIKIQSMVAWAMNYPDWESCEMAINQTRSLVSNMFSTLLSKQVKSLQKMNHHGLFLFQGKTSKSDSVALLTSYGFQKPEDIYIKCQSLVNSHIFQNIEEIGLSRIYQLIPVLIDTCIQDQAPDEALLRMLDIVHSTLRRTTYLVLLLERPEALKHLVRLCAGSLWITHEIVRYPELIDEFFSSGDLYNPPSLSQLKQDLQSQISYLAWDECELRLERLCYFKLSHILKNEIAQTSQYTPLTTSSNYLSWVAECIINEVVLMAWHQLIDKYGAPGGQDNASFVVLGYGKLGGFEMGPSSDLDLVFIHQAKTSDMTQGDQMIDNPTFFMRLAQKIIYFLSTITNFGKLYNVDVRLRPSGHAGPLVSSFNSFSKYQKESAWFWEFQALVKARVVAGWDDVLIKKLNRLRLYILRRGYPVFELKKRIKSYRSKMKILDRSSNYIFDIKHGSGGIIDFEFLVQYLVLRWGNQFNRLTQWTDNIRLLDELKTHHILTEAQVESMRQAYIAMREVIHQTARQEKDSLMTAQQFEFERNIIIQIWNEQLEDNQVFIQIPN